MKILGLMLVILLLPQFPPDFPPRERVPRLPNGKSRNLAILQQDYKKSKEDVAEIIKLAEKLQEEIEKNKEFVVDLRSIRKAEKIEELAKDIKKRMKRFQ